MLKCVDYFSSGNHFIILILILLIKYLNKLTPRKV